MFWPICWVVRGAVGFMSLVGAVAAVRQLVKDEPRPAPTKGQGARAPTTVREPA